MNGYTYNCIKCLSNGKFSLCKFQTLYELKNRLLIDVLYFIHLNLKC